MAGAIRLSKWKRWDRRREHSHLEMPGVYVLAMTRARLAERPFSWRRDIVYVGMTNARLGLAGRLQQFDDTISRKRTAHGGADRLRFRNHSYASIVRRLFVSIGPVFCDVKSHRPRDLRLMGKVAQFEFICLARYAQKYHAVPRFNDKERSPKK